MTSTRAALHLEGFIQNTVDGSKRDPYFISRSPSLRWSIKAIDLSMVEMRDLHKLLGDMLKETL